MPDEDPGGESEPDWCCCCGEEDEEETCCWAKVEDWREGEGYVDEFEYTDTERI